MTRTSPPPFERPLRAGVVGDDVVRVKKRLYQLGFLDETAVDNNVFGIATRRAVEKFQMSRGLDRTGRVDRTTHGELWKEN